MEEMTAPEEKESIANTLLNISTDKDLDENTRADAADVVLRYGTYEQKDRAKSIILELGYGDIEEKSSGSLMDRAKTIYNNSQNTHEFSDSVEKDRKSTRLKSSN